MYLWRYSAGLLGPTSKELDAAAKVMQNMTSSNYPPALVSQDKCIAVIPDPYQGRFYRWWQARQRCRGLSNGFGLGAPAFITMSGGSVGLQADAEHQDVVLLMDQQGADELRSGHWDLRVEAAAAGPSRRKEATESTGWKVPVLLIPIPAHPFNAPTRADQKVGADPDKDAIHDGLRQRHFFSGDAPWPSASTGICTTVSVCLASDRREEPLK